MFLVLGARAARILAGLELERRLFISACLAGLIRSGSE